MKLICIKETEKVGGQKLLDFTKGKIYEFEKCEDPEGWETKDDSGFKESFFDTSIMFAELTARP